MHEKNHQIFSTYNNRKIELNKNITNVHLNLQSNESRNSFFKSGANNLIKNVVKNKIITGPNAAGKTTILKSVIINIILSQRIGYGYYTDGVINPYKYFHCYINIPDNCSRDSLFQAEVRRCKNILTTIRLRTEIILSLQTLGIQVLLILNTC